MEKLISRYPGVLFIWDHAGMTCGADKEGPGFHKEMARTASPRGR